MEHVILNENDVSAADHELERLANKARLLDSLPECVLLVDDKRKVIAANARAETTLGAGYEQVIGLPIKDLFHEVDSSDGHALDIDLLISRVFASGEAELLDGSCPLIPGTPSQPGNEPQSVTISVTPSLPEVEPRTATVVLGQRPGWQPYRLRDAVLSMVSHELRTPLLHIKGFVTSLLESDIEWDAATRLDFLHTIDREADRLTSTVKDLMEISRMGSGDLPLHLEYADPYLLAYGAVDSASLFSRKHRVIVNVPENLPKVHVDVVRVSGVLVNLIENATKYSKEGSKIVIDAAEQPGCIRFTVSDEGIGIPREAYIRIFKMFYRVENEGKRSSGSGLGLAVCKAVLDAHKGEIWVESTPGKGSTFFFTIPLD